jgi:hypothetical protein
MQDGAGQSWWAYLLPMLSAAALLALAFTLAERSGWGCVALAGAAIAFVIALRVETAGRVLAGAVWLAESKSMAWLILPFAAAGLWAAGLAALALYAAGSFFWAQRQAHRRAAARGQD